MHEKQEKSPHRGTLLPQFFHRSLSTTEPYTPLSEYATVSKRNFIKTVCVTTLAGAVELKTGGLGKIIDFLSGELQEGNVVQRAMKLEQLMVRLHNDPTPQNRELIAHWLKFNVAELEARRQKLPITVMFIQHYLYGRGERIDITTPMLNTTLAELHEAAADDAVVKKPELSSILNKQYPSSTDKLAVFQAYISHRITQINISSREYLDQNKEYGYPLVIVSHTREEYAQLRSSGTEFPLKGKILLPAIGTDDLHTALGRYWLRFEGKARLRDLTEQEESSVLAAADTHAVDLSNVTLTLSDIYDYDRTVVSSYDASMLAVLTVLLQELLGQEKAFQLIGDLDFATSEWLRSTTFIHLDQHISGEALADAGFATPFKVEATFRLPKLTILSDQKRPIFKSSKKIA